MAQPLKPLLASRRLQDLPSDNSGSSAVEFALVGLVLITVLVGLMDVGRLLWANHTLQRAAVESVRFASVRGASSPEPASADDVAAYITSSAIGLDPNHLAVTTSWAPNNEPGSIVTVRTTYAFEFLLRNLIPVGPIVLQSAPSIKIIR